jgi:hypothetical protein
MELNLEVVTTMATFELVAAVSGQAARIWPVLWLAEKSTDRRSYH